MLKKFTTLIIVLLSLHYSCSSQSVSDNRYKWNIDISGSYGRPLVFNEGNMGFGLFSVDIGYRLGPSFSLQANLAYTSDFAGIDIYITSINARKTQGRFYVEYGLGILTEVFVLQDRSDMQLIGIFEAGLPIAIGKGFFIEPFIEILIPSIFIVPDIGVSLSKKF